MYKKIALILLCAGESTRLHLPIKKHWLYVAKRAYKRGQPLWLYLLSQCQKQYAFSEIVLVAHAKEIAYMRHLASDVVLVEGGSSRQASIKNGLQVLSDDSELVCIHDVARAGLCEGNLLHHLLNDALTQMSEGYAKHASVVVPYINVPDTASYSGAYLQRENLRLIQTPQISVIHRLKKAINTPQNFTDESSAIAHLGDKVAYIKGSVQLHKITHSDDVLSLPLLKKSYKNLKKYNPIQTGIGVDIHAFEEGKKMVLGSVTMPYDYGFKAHSDGDVLIHSIIDALLGAIGAGDIGEFFPDSDERYKDANSAHLLQEIARFTTQVGFVITHIDVSILAQKPKITPYKNEIKNSLCTLLYLNRSQINIKATTAEKMGFVGREEGVMVYSVVSVERINPLIK